MMKIPSRRVGLLGATGYTGSLVVAELARREIPHRLGARSVARLDGVTGLDPHAERMAVDALDASSLDAFCAGIDVLVTTVGPFAALGAGPAEAAARAGIAYVDSTGEPEFISWMYKSFTDAAGPMVPACAADYVPGDLAAAVAAERVRDAGERPVRAEVVYRLSRMLPSRGTVASALGALATAPDPGEVCEVDFAGGTEVALTIPWGEDVTVPRHVPGATLSCRIVIPHATGRAAERLAGPLARVLRLGVPLAERLVPFLPAGPKPARRSHGWFRVEATVYGDAGTATRSACSVTDIYGFSARCLVAAALRVEGRGGLAPAEALDAPGFLDELAALCPGTGGDADSAPGAGAGFGTRSPAFTWSVETVQA